MRFKLGDLVKARASNSYGSPALKGKIVSIFYRDYNSGSVVYTIKGSHSNYNYLESDVTLQRTQTLYAYEDVAKEVHWTTREHLPTDMKNMGLTKRSEFDKIIELE